MVSGVDCGEMVWILIYNGAPSVSLPGRSLSSVDGLFYHSCVDEMVCMENKDVWMASLKMLIK